MDHSTFDHIILGGGLAGLALASSLLKRNKRICLIEKDKIASGASGTPLGLVNPATGRYAAKSWRAEECYKAVSADLKEVQESNPDPFYKETGVVRPALSKKIARRMKENTKESNWPEDWVYWKTEKQINDGWEGLNVEVGGIWLPIGLTVDIGQYLRTKASMLKSNGLELKTALKAEVIQAEKGWEVRLKDMLLKTETVIYATGSESSKSKHWSELPLHPVKGQVARFKSDKVFPYRSSISALGYLGSLKKNEFTAGSTYEHDFDHADPDEQGAVYLKERMRKVVPDLMNESKLIGQWAGVRASTPDRKPFLGQHPDLAGMYIFAGLGSKGMLYSAYMAKLLSDHILNDKELPTEISIERLNK